MKKLRWGILSSAKIARTKVIPALTSSRFNEVVAIASRHAESAKQTAAELNIPTFYSSYEELLADPNIDAIYNPLPNHLHVPWSIKALEAGKHVLCEKPIGLNRADALQLKAVSDRYPELTLFEGFMYQFHPQWKKALALIEAGAIGKLRLVHSHFSYNNRDAGNIRNSAAMGGGGLMDIGCYCVALNRLLFKSSPAQVIAFETPFDGYEVDCLISGLMQFATGQATFSASTKVEADQYVDITGEDGKIRIPIPFNPIEDETTSIILQQHKTSQVITLAAADHYREMADTFAQAVLNQQPLPTNIDDAINNMAVIDALFLSIKENVVIHL